MALHLWYHDADVGTIEITDHVKYGLGQIQLTMTAIQGTQDTNEIIVEDPDGIYNFKGLQIFFATEDEADFERIYTGQVWVKSVQRGDYYRTGPGRTWNLQIQNINSAFYAYVMTGEDDSRPEESDVERVQWLLSTNEASPFTDVTTYIFTDRPVDMDANPDPGYNGQMFNQVLDDCSQQSGKNWFTFDYFDYAEDDYKQAVWYGHDDLDDFTSEATISNVLSEVDNVTVFWSDVATKLDRDPSRVFSGIFANYDGGWVYESRAETITEYHHRDTIMSWPNVKSSARASARAQRMLRAFAAEGEEDTVTCTIYSMLPSQASVFRAGHRVNGVKFTHLPGWEDGVDVRIVRRTLHDQAIGLYSVELEMLPIHGPASSCAVVGNQMEALDTGVQGPEDAPYVAQPADVTMDTAIVLAQFFVSEGTGFISGGITLSGDFIELQRFDDAGGGGTHSCVLGAYYPASAGTPPTFQITGTGGSGGPPEWRVFTYALNTAATAPVQSAIALNGDTVTLDDPPTVGNILVLMQFAEEGAYPTPFPPDGWHYFADQYAPPDGVIGANGFRMLAAWHCVNSEDGEAIYVGNASFNHWAIVSEWEIT